MRHGAGAASRVGASPGWLRDGRGLCVARIAAALRGRTRQRAMEPGTIPRRARLGLAVAQSGDRNVAARRTERTAERNGGGGDDPRRSRAAQRDFRCYGSPLPILAGDAGHAQGRAVVTTLAVTINGRAYGPMDLRDELTMNDFLREYLGLTGTKFGCGAAQCLSCAVS